MMPKRPKEAQKVAEKLNKNIKKPAPTPAPMPNYYVEDLILNQKYPEPA